MLGGLRRPVGARAAAGRGGVTQLRANIASMLVWQVGAYLIPLLTFPFLTRVLGVRGFGEFGFAFAVASYMAMISDWGFNLSASGQVARARDDGAALTRLFWNTLAAKALLAAMCLAVLTGIVAFYPPARAMAPTMFAASGMVIANALTVNWALQGLERMGTFAVASLSGRVLTVPATFLLVHGPGDSWVAALVQSLGAIIGGGASLVLIGRTGLIGRAHATVGGVVDQLRKGWPLFVSILSANIYTSMNAIVLGVVAGPGVLGYYAAADRLRNAAQGVVSPISQAVYPHAMRLMAQDDRAGLAFAQRLMLIQGGITLLISLTMFCAAPLIILILAGPRFDAAVVPLMLLAPVPFLVGLSNVMGVQMMLPLGMEQHFSRVLMSAAGVNLLAVVPLSVYGGAPGTACATLLSEIYVAGAMVAVLKRSGYRLLPERKAA